MGFFIWMNRWDGGREDWWMRSFNGLAGGLFACIYREAGAGWLIPTVYNSLV